jgi:hypothetical protein
MSTLLERADSGGISTGILLWGVKPQGKPWIVFYTSFATQFVNGRATRATLPLRVEVGLN